MSKGNLVYFHSNIRTGSNATERLFTGLEPDTAYIFRVSAQNDKGDSVVSTEASTSITTLPLTVPDPPSDLVITVSCTLSLFQLVADGLRF